MARILLMSIGSRGDMEPFLALLHSGDKAVKKHHLVPTGVPPAVPPTRKRPAAALPAQVGKSSKRRAPKSYLHFVSKKGLQSRQQTKKCPAIERDTGSP